MTESRWYGHCKVCQNPIAESEDICSVCAEEFRKLQANNSAKAARRKSAQLRKEYVGIVVVVPLSLGLVALIGLAAASFFTSKDGEPIGSHQKYDTSVYHELSNIDAWVMATTFVKRQLKAPSSADFGSPFGEYQNPEKCVEYLGNGRYRIAGWVDAQNAFGAKLRNRFVCELEFRENDNCQLMSLSFTK